jgi:DNA polymerase
MTIDEWKVALSGDKSFEALLSDALAEVGESVIQYTKFGKRGAMLALAKGDIPRQHLENHQSEKVKALMQGRIAIESWPKHADKVRGFVAQAKALGGRMPVALRYAGAHTLRWSGSDGNMQNLGARGHELVSRVRGIFVAPVGHKIAVVDLAAIEARVSAWLAGQDDLISGFRENRDVYCEFGTRFYGVLVRKPKAGGIPSIEAKMKARRQLSKVAILGASYGMGAGRFEEYAGCDADTAAKVIRAYREMYPMIPAFWKSVEQAFIYTARYGAPCELPRGLRFEHLDDCDVQIILPSGHTLQYHRVKLVAGKYNDTAEVYNSLTHSWNPIWGGELLENITQSVSRHILAESMLRLEALGIRIALHCHDELVAVVKDEKAEQALALMISEMSKTPEWAPGLPLDASGHISSRYGKD